MAKDIVQYMLLLIIIVLVILIITDDQKEPRIEQAATVAIIEPETVDVLYNSADKSYMDYRAITDETSAQWVFIHKSNKITIDSKGYLRNENKAFGVALGSYFGPIGSEYVFYLSSGEVLPVVKVEEKADRDTVDGYIGKDGTVIEFVIDTQAAYMRENIYPNGYIYGGNFNRVFAGNILKIENVKKMGE